MRNKKKKASTNANAASGFKGETTGPGISRRKFLSGTLAAAGLMTMQCSLKNEGSALPHSMDMKQIENTAPRTPIIDVHRHCMWKPADTADKMMELVLKQKIDWEDYSSYSTVTVDGITSIAYHELNDIDIQVRKQDEAGITMGILSFSMELELICRELPLVPDDMVTRKVNDATASIAAKYPDKLSFMAMVNPFQEGSVAECERCINHLGAKGVNISTSWEGEFLDSDKLNPFWEYAQAKDIPVFLHPPFVPVGYRKMNKYRLEEVIGRPFDTTMAIAGMIYSGVFDRYPNLKIVLPHMAGGLPSVIGRLDFGYRLGYDGLPQGQEAVCRRMPSEYLRANLYADIMGFSSHGIRHCIELFGTDRMLFGTDYPAVNISPVEHIQLIRSLGLGKENEDKIFWKNAKDLFKLA